MYEGPRLHTLIRHVFHWFGHLGGFGLLGMGILDSSFLFMPLGNDLLIIVLSSRKPSLFWYYALMATAGSLLGCFLTDLVSRHIGEAGLEKMVQKKRLERVQKRMESHGWWVIGGSALMPPPFPFTVFLMAASALQYPRTKLFAAIGVGRMVRFTVLGSLAYLYGRHVLRLIHRPEVEYVVLGLAALSIVGSVFSVMKWVRSSRAGSRRTPASSASEQAA